MIEQTFPRPIMPSADPQPQLRVQSKFMCSHGCVCSIYHSQLIRCGYFHVRYILDYVCMEWLQNIWDKLHYNELPRKWMAQSKSEWPCVTASFLYICYFDDIWYMSNVSHYHAMDICVARIPFITPIRVVKIWDKFCICRFNQAAFKYHLSQNSG